MKQLLFLLTTILGVVTASAQQTDFNTVIYPIEQKAKDFSEYLVQLAWLNNPENSALQEQVKQSKDEVKLVKKDWMKDLQLTFNLNEANLLAGPTLPTKLYNSTGALILDSSGQAIPLTGQLFDATGKSVPLKSAGGSAFYPRFNFGLNFNLGNVLGQKNKNQIKQHDVVIAEHKVNQQKLGIRAEVLTRYQAYKFAKEILKVRVQVEQDANASFILVNEQYKKDEADFGELNEASGAYHQAQESRIKAESEVSIAKIQLEEIIGIKWEQLQHPQKDL